MLARRIEIMCGSFMCPWELFKECLLELEAWKPILARAPPESEGVRDLSQLVNREGWNSLLSKPSSWSTLTLEPRSIRPLGKMIPRIADNAEFRMALQSSAVSLVRTLSQYSRDLWGLLAATAHLRCFEPLDKVYALLGVAEQSNIIPDYNMSMPALLNAVLRDAHSECPPQSIEQVSWRCSELERLMDVPTSTIFSMIKYESRSTLPLGQENGVSLWWTDYYRHEVIAPLLFREGLVHGNLALVEACSKGDTRAISILLQTGELDVNRPRGTNFPLIVAILRNQHNVVEVLLRVDGINTNQNWNGRVSLLVAAANSNFEIMDLLLRHPTTSPRLAVHIPAGPLPDVPTLICMLLEKVQLEQKQEQQEREAKRQEEKRRIRTYVTSSAKAGHPVYGQIDGR